MSSTKTKKNTKIESLNRTLWFSLQVIATVVLTTVLIIMMVQARPLSYPIVADPTKGYTPLTVDSQSWSGHLGEWLLSTPLTWVALALLLFIWVGARASRRVGPGVIAVVITMSAIASGYMITTGSDEDTFATWAKERYGIEMETYPQMTSGLFGTDPDTATIVILDNGQAVSLKTYTDARGNEAFVLVDASDESSSPDELDTIVEP